MSKSTKKIHLRGLAITATIAYYYFGRNRRPDADSNFRNPHVSVVHALTDVIPLCAVWWAAAAADRAASDARWDILTVVRSHFCCSKWSR